jgi:hypothetical protein
MSRANDIVRAERKALLATRAELDRTRVALAIHDIKAVVMPAREFGTAEHFKPTASVLVRILGPIAGASRLGRWLRIASVVLTGVRIVRNWKSA